jgi:hypothetical protein
MIEVGGKIMPTVHSKIHLTAHRRIWKIYVVMLSCFMLLSISSELLDVPYYLLGDQATSFAQRKGELMIELLIYVGVICFSFYFFNTRLKAQIKILEGFIPICANCKKIRQDIDWKTLEEYISENSLAQFTHSICPECIRSLYPEVADKLLSDNN